MSTSASTSRSTGLRRSSSDPLLKPLSLTPVRNYGTEFVSVGGDIPAEEQMKYTWMDLNAYATVKKRRRHFFGSGDLEQSEASETVILKDIEGVACPGEILAIMGGSGSGKTTLLNALTFTPMNDIRVSGRRCVNGVPVNDKNIRSVSGYVQQNDLFIPTLSVKEHLIFQALVRMDERISYDTRMRRVEQVLSELLLKKCEDTLIGSTDQGGISGGEKRRLSFAAELLTNPHLLFCDEPTSGLDSFMALQVVQALKAMAQSGKTIIFTIHQPSSELYAMFDKILLLADGSLAFFGGKNDAESFFNGLSAKCPINYNPADYYIKLLSIIPEKEESCREAIEVVVTRFVHCTIGLKATVEARYTRSEDEDTRQFWANAEIKSPYKNSSWAQFRAVLWRSWISIVKDPLLVRVRLMQTVITSLLIGFIYYGQELNQEGVMNINGALFIFLTNMTFQNVFAVIYVFTAELPIFLRENRNGMYRTDIYFISKTLAELPFFIILPVVFITVCYFLIGLNASASKFFITCGIVILVANVALSYGYLVSCIATSTSMALTLASPLIIPFLLFGGYFMNINSIPIYFKWLSYISWFKFGNEALMINQWEDVTKINCPDNSTVCPRNGHVVLQAYSFFEEQFVVDIVALVCLIIGFRLAAFLVLLRKTYSQ